MRAFKINPKAEIYVYPYFTRMSASFPKLIELADTVKVTSKVDGGDLFVFVNKAKSYVKILFWETNGWCIFAKKLPVGTFDIEQDLDTWVTLGQMQKLVDHISMPGKKKKQPHLKRAA